MNNTPDYDNYTLDELFQAQSAINRELYPDRAEKIEALIAKQLKEPAIRERFEKQEQNRRYSTFGLRFVAAIIDGIILSIVSKLLIYAASTVNGVGAFVFNSLDIFLFVIYSVLFHGLFSQTVGKMLMGVVLLDAKTEEYIGFGHAMLRDSVIIALTAIAYSIILIGSDESGIVGEEYVNWLIMVAIANFVWFLIEVITMLFNKKNRALHDFIGGTVVVRE